ncbi:PREDICTED: uncharacterized protein LOC108782420 [Cyphomyrmex costatus]|uniref:uncharacterized protein LOC108782420 n=1 Tax=Cyphomyrmex costatus TaxID=456900 RepID=UPI00085238C8|nr:PREDICTED: uncharacterized protein LOC108782420 [Cyphomyrmex costatus]
MEAVFWIVNLVIEERQKLKLMRRYLRDVSDPFSVPESQFLQLYRLSKECALDLCNNLRPYMPQEQRSTAIPLELKVLATLNFIASGSYQRRVGQDFLSCMSQASMSKISKPSKSSFGTTTDFLE